MFEFQTAISELTGLPVVERVALRGPVVGRGRRLPGQARRPAARRFVVSRGLHPHSRETLATYCRRLRQRGGRGAARRPARPTPTRSQRRSTTTPPRCSCSSPTSSARSRTSRRSRPSQSGPERCWSSPVDALTLGVLRPPGEFGADIALGEGQPLGNRLDFGGPSFGFFAATRGVHPAHAGPHRGRDARRRRAARLRAHAPDARAAHPPREGDLEHLHEPGAERARRRGLPALARASGGSSSSAS